MIQRDFWRRPGLRRPLGLFLRRPQLLGTAGDQTGAAPAGRGVFPCSTEIRICPWTTGGGRLLPAQRAAGLMTVYRNEGLYDTSNVVFRDGQIAVYDKKLRLPEMRQH